MKKKIRKNLLKSVGLDQGLQAMRDVDHLPHGTTARAITALRDPTTDQGTIETRDLPRETTAKTEKERLLESDIPKNEMYIF